MEQSTSTPYRPILRFLTVLESKVLPMRVRSRHSQMFNLVSIFWIFRKKFRLLFLSQSCEIYVPKTFIGSAETFISRGLVLLSRGLVLLECNAYDVPFKCILLAHTETSCWKIQNVE